MKIPFSLLIALLTFNILAQPQWEFRGLENEQINDIVVDDSGNVYVASVGGIFKSTNNGSNWIFKNNGLDIVEVYKLFIDYNENIYLAGVGFSNTGYGLYKSIDGGENWMEIADTLNRKPINNFYDVTVIPNKPGGFIYVSNHYGVYRSTDNGVSWQVTNFINTGATYLGINTNDYMFFGNYTASWFGIYRSTDMGLNWVRETLLGVESIVYLRDGSLLAGCYDPGLGNFGIYKTTNNGINWENTNAFTGLNVPTDFVLDTNQDIYASIVGPNRGAYISTDSGNLWTDYGLSGTEYSITCLAIDSSGYVWAGTNMDGIYKTEGRTIPVELVSFNAEVNNNNVILKWITATELNNRGFEIERKVSLNSLEGRAPGTWEEIGYIAGFGTTVEQKSYSFIDKNVATTTFQYRLKQIDFDGSFEYSHIVEISINAPDQFELYQNYPNPFNPKTTIKFSIEEPAVISMNLYSTLGEKITSIIKEKKFDPGIHEIEFESKNIPSGIYLYRIQTNDKSDVKKLTIIK